MDKQNVSQMTINVWMEDNYDKVDDFTVLGSIVEQAKSMDPPESILFVAENILVAEANKAVTNL
jgi:hypothetical protein